MSVAQLPTDVMNNSMHYPVMYREVLEYLNPAQSKVILDCTVGVGAHAQKLLSLAPQDSSLIGIDKDEESLGVASEKLKLFGGRAVLVKDDFINLDKVLNNLNMKYVDSILFDLGISTYQLSCSWRGFSFTREGPLDMRMDKDSFICASDLVNNLSEAELTQIFRRFGEERHAHRVARYLVETRKREPICTTTQLVTTILKAMPPYTKRLRIHPATKIFQALRIAVNRELEALRVGLDKAVNSLNRGGRICVISFHSLEDRTVKHFFKELAQKRQIQILTKKPRIPTPDECSENPSSRSGKLRVAEKI